MPDPLPPSGAEDDRAFSGARRTLTLGILLGVTLVGFESLAVVTVAPAIAEGFGHVDRYGWIFSSFLLAALLGSVIAGHALDRLAPRSTLLAALVLFGSGLAYGGVSRAMTGLLIARALQGLGGGGLVTALYVAVTRAYPDRVRPRVMALMSSAWVLPALLGPTVAGAVATAVGWRAVFLGLLPVVAAVAALTSPAFARLERRDGSAPFASRLRSACFLVGGTFLLLLGLEAHATWGWPAVVAGALVAQHGLRPLLPYGTLSLRRGLPAAVGARGSIYPAFVTAQTMVSLMLVTHFGTSPALAGGVLALASLSWTAGAWLQERLDAATGPAFRGTRIAVGAGMVTVGLVVQTLALALPSLVWILAAAGWIVAGAGIGLAHSTSSVHVFALTGRNEAGAASASLQIVDQFGAALCTGLAGAVFAAILPTRFGAPGGIAVAMIASAGLALAGVVAGLRSRDAGSARDGLKPPHV